MSGMSLSLGLGLGSSRPTAPSKPPLCQAIEAKVMVTANDGNIALKLAPHVVYKRGRREVVTLDAVLVERNGQPVNRESLRTYAVADLSDITITNDGFAILPDFDPGELEYAGRTICIVKTI